MRISLEWAKTRAIEALVIFNGVFLMEWASGILII